EPVIERDANSMGTWTPSSGSRGCGSGAGDAACGGSALLLLQLRAHRGDECLEALERAGHDGEVDDPTCLVPLDDVDSADVTTVDRRGEHEDRRGLIEPLVDVLDRGAQHLERCPQIGL